MFNIRMRIMVGVVDMIGIVATAGVVGASFVGLVVSAIRVFVDTTATLLVDVSVGDYTMPNGSLGGGSDRRGKMDKG